MISVITLPGVVMEHEGVMAPVSVGTVMHSRPYETPDGKRRASAVVRAIYDSAGGPSIHGTDNFGDAWVWDARGLNWNAWKGWDVDISALPSASHA